MSVDTELTATVREPASTSTLAGENVRPHGGKTIEGDSESDASRMVSDPPRRPSKRAWIVSAALGSSIALGGLFFRLRTVPATEMDVPTDAPRLEGHTVVISPKLRERIGIRTAEVREAALVPVVKAVGTVTFDPAHVAAVGTRLRGLVRTVSRFEGDVVKEGDLLATIDSPELGSAQASVLMYDAQLRAAELNAQREADLAARGLTTQREVEESAATVEEYRSKLMATEQQVSALGGAPVHSKKVPSIGVHQLRSPLAGTVVERHVSPGQAVEMNLTAFRVADLEHLWVEVAIYERDIPAIRLGDRVELNALSDQKTSITGEVAHVGEVVDPSTRAAEIRVEVENKERKIRPGQAVTARVHATGRGKGKVVQVPRSAITYVDGKPTVFRAESDLRFIATPVELGDNDGKDQQVISGLDAGQFVAIGGVFALKSELFR